MTFVSLFVWTYDAAGNRTAKTTEKAHVAYDLPYGAEGNRLAGWSAAVSNDFLTAAAVTGWSTETIGTHPWLGQLYVSNAVAVVAPAVAGTNFSVAAMPLGLGANELTAAIGDEAGNVGYASATVTVSVVTNAAYAYDAAGCVTNVSFHAAGVESRTALAWNSRYEMTTVRTNGVFAEKYQYDAIGRRVSTSNGSTTNWLVYDGMHVVAETDKNGTLQKSYVYGPGIDNALAMTVHAGPSAGTYYYLIDHLGTVHALANTNGVIVESYKYDAWGRVLGVYDGNGAPIANQQSAIGNSILWQGREYSWKTGLYYFRARWYDPITGRWLSNDPIGISGGLNQYVFCYNNPVNFVDPAGLDAYQMPGSYTTYWAVDTPTGIKVFHYSAVSWGQNNNGWRNVQDYARVLTRDRAEVTVTSVQNYFGYGVTDDAFRQLVRQKGRVYNTDKCQDSNIEKDFDSYYSRQNQLWYNAFFRNCYTTGHDIFKQNIGPNFNTQVPLSYNGSSLMYGVQ